jgi:formylglycine-generating enzyme required for sulfatase activity
VIAAFARILSGCDSLFGSGSDDTAPMTDIPGPAVPTDEPPRRMVRGGSIGSEGAHLHYLQSGFRDSEPPWNRPEDFGLRPVRRP